MEAVRGLDWGALERVEAVMLLHAVEGGGGGLRGGCMAGGRGGCVETVWKLCVGCVCSGVGGGGGVWAEWRLCC